MTSLKTKLLRGVVPAVLACVAAGMASADPGNYNQQGPKLVGSGAVGAAAQGYSVALSADGNTALVFGGGDNKDRGAVWAFTRSNGVWAQQGQKLVDAGFGAQPPYGALVALSADGNTAVVGATPGGGGVLVFTRSNGVWTQQGPELVGTGGGEDLEPLGDSQGAAVAISADGNTLAEGDPYNGNNSCGDNCVVIPGAVWVFTRSNGVWTQQGPGLFNRTCEQFAPDSPCYAEEGWGVALSADGNTLAAGGFYSWVYTRSNGVWSLQAQLSAPASVPTLQGPVSLTADGNTLLAGYGSPYVVVGQFFQRKNGQWQAGSQVNAPTGYLGLLVVSADGSTVAAEETDANGLSVNKVAVFEQVHGAWAENGEYTGSGAVGNAHQGASVALSANGNTMIEGVLGDNNNTGAAWIFASPELTTSLTHTGNFVRGGAGTYTITVTNAGDRDIHAGPSSAVDGVDELPTGLSAAAMFGIGWNCDITTFTCTRDDGLAVGASFPPLTVTVKVASNAPSTVTNQAIAEGGGSTWGTAKDVTTIQP